MSDIPRVVGEKCGFCDRYTGEKHKATCHYVETIRLHECEKNYYELLFAVGRKYEGETRHQTALRYIREAESQESRCPAQNMKAGTDAGIAAT